MRLFSRRRMFAALFVLPLILGFGWFDKTKSRMEDNLWHIASPQSGTDMWNYDTARDVRFVKGDMTINGVVYGKYKFIDDKVISFHKLGADYGVHVRIEMFGVLGGEVMQWILKNPNGSERVYRSFGRPDTYEQIL